MQKSYLIPLTENLTGTLIVRIKVGKETTAQAMRMGIDPEELQNIVHDKLQDITDSVAEVLRIESDGWEE